MPARLIDSNLDWGQDLVALQKWCKKTIPGQPIGLAYFGQINPSIFTLRGDSFDWFLPPVRPGTMQADGGNSRTRSLIGPAKRLTPGYYAVSATLLYGLPWRLYDPADPESPGAWHRPGTPGLESASNIDAFWYFRQFEPIKKIGHSIYVYHLDRGRRGAGGTAPSWHERPARDQAVARLMSHPACDRRRPAPGHLHGGGPKTTSTSKPARWSKSGKSAPNSVKTG